jgi:hypothetical protein
VAGFVRVCAGSDSGGGHLTASRSASARVTGGGGHDMAVSFSAPCLAHREHLQGPATCREGGVVSGCGWQVGTHLLVPFPFPLLLWLLVVVGCCSYYRGHRRSPGGRGSGSVVEGNG